MEIQIVEAQLSDSDCSTSNRSDKTPLHEQKYSQMMYSEATN
jgi:hypothetical protein